MYVTSLAVMSMVGYILGLGDRHPNNLMLNRNSGIDHHFKTSNESYFFSLLISSQVKLFISILAIVSRLPL